ncbi:MAG: sensor histidine kinase [Calditrichia bacterium]
MKTRYYLSMLSPLPLLLMINMVYLLSHRSVLVFFQLSGVLFVLYGLLSLLNARWIYKPIAQLYDHQNNIEAARDRIKKLTFLSTLGIFIIGILFNLVAQLPLFIDSSIYRNIETFSVDKMPLGFLLLGIPPTFFIFAVLPTFIASLVIGDFSLDLRKQVHQKFGIAYAPGKSKVRKKLLVVIIILVLMPALLTILEIYTASEFAEHYEVFSQMEPVESIAIDRVAILLSVIVAILVLSRSLTKPLDFLLEKIEAVRAGNYSTRVAVTTSDEFSIVTGAFNSMISELESSQRSLEEANQTLEQKVEARTLELSEKNIKLEETLNQLQEMQKQIILQEKMAGLGQLVAGLTHEINTPIGAMRSMNDTKAKAIAKLQSALNNRAADSEKSEREISKALNIIENADQLIDDGTTRLGELMSNLKNFARLDESEYLKADIHEGIDSALALLAHDMSDKIEINRSYADIPPLICNARMLNQVFFNIIKNAGEAIEGVGEISITSRLTDGAVYIEIKDTGRGIAQSELETIFSPSFTTRSAKVRARLGLATSYQIVQDHDGQIEVESRVGNGSTFTVILPIKRSE